MTPNVTSSGSDGGFVPVPAKRFGPFRLTFDDSKPSGPVAALRLTASLPSGTDPKSSAAEVADLCLALSDYDREKGGLGLVIDYDRSGISEGNLVVLLRPKDIRGSVARFGEMAALLGGDPTLRPLPESPGDGGSVIEDILDRFHEPPTEARPTLPELAQLTARNGSMRVEVVHGKAP